MLETDTSKYSCVRNFDSASDLFKYIRTASHRWFLVDPANNPHFPAYFAKDSRDNGAYQTMALEKSYRMDTDRLGVGWFCEWNSPRMDAKSSFGVLQP